VNNVCEGQIIIPACGAEDTEGMVSYWKADGNADDLLGNNNGQLINGATAASEGTLGNAFSTTGCSFGPSGCGSYLNFGYLNGIDGANEYTLVMWVKSSEGGMNILYSYSSPTVTLNPTVGVIYAYNPSSNLVIGGYPLALEYSTGLIVADDTWHMLTISKGASSFSVYKDKTGSSINPQPIGGSLPFDPSWYFSIGQGHNSAGYNGLSDEVAFFNRSLSAADVSALYDRIIAGNPYCTVVAPPAVPTCGENDTQGMISYWKGETDGSDSYGSNTATEYGGITHPAGKVGNAFNFDGVNDALHIINTESNFDFEWNSPFAIEFWAKYDLIIPGPWFHTVFYDKQIPVEQPRKGIKFYLSSDGHLGAVIQHNYDTSLAQYVPDYPVTAHDWKHFALTYDGSGSYTGIKIYINGVSQTLIRDAATTISETIINDEPVRIGDFHGWSYFNGELDEYAVYNRALSAGEVAAHFSRGDANQPYCTTGPAACTDADGDGWNSTDVCNTPATADCNDANANVNPTAPEVCDDVDNNCDGQTDEGANVFYKDADGDGYGGPSQSISTICTAKAGYVANNLDCNDNNAAVNPAAIDGPYQNCDTTDNDCDAEIDEGCACISGQSRACYAGSPETRNVGICHDGVEHCINGNWEGTCEGQQLPMLEGDQTTCWDNVDNDCDSLIDKNDDGCTIGGVQALPDCTLNEIFDLNGDGAINVQDIVHLQRWIAWNLLGRQGAEPELLNIKKGCELWSVKKNPNVVMDEQSLC